VYCISTPHAPRDLLTRLAFRRVAVTVFLTERLAQRALAEAPFMRRAGHRVIRTAWTCDLFPSGRGGAGLAFRRRYTLGDGPGPAGGGALEIEKRWDLLLASMALLAPPAPPLVLCGTRRPSSGRCKPIASGSDWTCRFLGQMDSGQLDQRLTMRPRAWCTRAPTRCSRSR